MRMRPSFLLIPPRSSPLVLGHLGYKCIHWQCQYLPTVHKSQSESGFINVVLSICWRHAGTKLADSELPERMTEMSVVGGINEWVHKRVGVSEPRQRAANGVTHSTRVTERLDDVEHKERQPTDDESADNYRQRLGGFVLPPSRPLARRPSPLVLRRWWVPQVDWQRSTRSRRRLVETPVAEGFHHRASVRRVGKVDVWSVCSSGFAFNADHFKALAIASRLLSRHYIALSVVRRRRTVLCRVYRLVPSAAFRRLHYRCRRCRRGMSFHGANQRCSSRCLRYFQSPRLLIKPRTLSQSDIRWYSVSRHFENVAVKNQHHYL